MAGNSAQMGRSVTSKITSILLTFTQGNVHSLTEIARLTGLPISTAHRLTAELTALRLLERTDDGRYRVGLPLRSVGPPRTVEDEAHSITQRAPSVLADLCAVTKHRARLGTLQDLVVAYVEREPGQQSAPLFSTAGTLPAHPTAMGRAVLAFSPRPLVETIIQAGLRPYTAHTITSPDRFRRAIAVTQLTRVAITRGEWEPGACGIAMPVFGAGGNVVAAIELTFDHWGDRLDPLLTALTIATRSLSRELAGQARELPAPPAERPEIHDVALAAAGVGPGLPRAE